MNINFTRAARPAYLRSAYLRCAASLCAVALSASVLAQNATQSATQSAAQPQAQPTPLSSPIKAEAPMTGVIKQPGGNHPLRQPNLPDVVGAVPWSVLNNVKVRNAGGRLLPLYPPPVLAFNQKDVRVQGFMIPLEPGEKQSHFLLTNVPTSCSFCMPAGPEGIVEVRTKTPVKYSLEPVTVTGKFAVLQNDSTGLYYRLTGGSAVSP
jgi:uncharacterized protein